MGSELYFQVCGTCVDLSPDLVAKGMLHDKSKVGAAMMVSPKDRISWFSLIFYIHIQFHLAKYKNEVHVQLMYIS